MKEKAASILTGCLRFFQPTVLTLPLVFSLLGLGSASVTTILARYRHAFLVLTFFSLGFSFYLNYLKVHAHFMGWIIFRVSVFIALCNCSWKSCKPVTLL